jgi:hypothetical protein
MFTVLGKGVGPWVDSKNFEGLFCKMNRTTCPCSEEPLMPRFIRCSGIERVLNNPDYIIKEKRY